MRYFPIVWESNVFQEYIFFFFSELKARELLSRKNDARGRAWLAIPEDYSNSRCILQTY